MLKATKPKLLATVKSTDQNRIAFLSHFQIQDQIVRDDFLVYFLGHKKEKYYAQTRDGQIVGNPRISIVGIKPWWNFSFPFPIFPGIVGMRMAQLGMGIPTGSHSHHWAIRHLWFRLSLNLLL